MTLFGYSLCLMSRKLYGSIQDVVVPLMYMEYTTRKVLVMEWIEVFVLSCFCCMFAIVHSLAGTIQFMCGLENHSE